MELSITMTLNESSMKGVSMRENDLAGEFCMIEVDWFNTTDYGRMMNPILINMITIQLIILLNQSIFITIHIAMKKPSSFPSFSVH